MLRTGAQLRADDDIIAGDEEVGKVKRNLAGVATVILFAVSGLGFIVWSPEVLFNRHSDLVAENIATQTVLHDSWTRGEWIPLWRDDQLSGAPAFTNPQASYSHPLHALFAFFPPARVVGLVLWLELALAAIGAYPGSGGVESFDTRTDADGDRGPLLVQDNPRRLCRVVACNGRRGGLAVRVRRRAGGHGEAVAGECDRSRARRCAGVTRRASAAPVLHRCLRRALVRRTACAREPLQPQSRCQNVSGAVSWGGACCRAVCISAAATRRGTPARHAIRCERRVPVRQWRVSACRAADRTSSRIPRLAAG